MLNQFIQAEGLTVSNYVSVDGHHVIGLRVDGQVHIYSYELTDQHEFKQHIMEEAKDKNITYAIAAALVLQSNKIYKSWSEWVITL